MFDAVNQRHGIAADCNFPAGLQGTANVLGGASDKAVQGVSSCELRLIVVLRGHLANGLPDA